MKVEPARHSVTVIAAGNVPATLIDDVVTNTRHSLAPGAGASLLLGNGDDGWEPKPLPGPVGPSSRAAAGGGEKGKGWEPKPLPLFEPDLELVAATPSELRVDAEALATIEAGKVVKVQLLETTELSLSHLAGLAEAAHSSPGQVVVELHGDG